MATPQEKIAAAERHLPPTGVQSQHQQFASHNQSLFSKVNNGKPAIAAVTRPGNFSGPGVFAAKSAGPATPAALNRGALSNGVLSNRNNGSPNSPYSRTSHGFHEKRFGKGFDRRNAGPAGLYRSHGSGTRYNPAFDRRFQGSAAFNPGPRPNFNRGPGGGRPPFNAGRRQFGGMGRPPMHFPQGGPARMMGKQQPKGNWRR